MDTTENLYALCIAIFNNVTVENAFHMFKTGKTSCGLLTNEDLEDMIELKKTITYRELEEIYCISTSTICHRMADYKKKTKFKNKTEEKVCNINQNHTIPSQIKYTF